MLNEGEVLLVSFLDFVVSCFHLTWTKTSGEAKNYDFSKYFFSLCTNPESAMTTCRTLKNGKLTHIHPSHRLFLFCILLKLYTTKFESKRSSLRCDPLEQKNLAQKPGMKMLTLCLWWLRALDLRSEFLQGEGGYCPRSKWSSVLGMLLIQARQFAADAKERELPSPDS